MNTWHDDKIRDEEADKSIATETADVGPNDGVNFADEGLHKCVKSANLFGKI